MIKVLMGKYPEISEVKVNIEDIKLKNNKYCVNGEEHAMLCETSDILEVFYTGVKKALNGEITLAEAEAFLEKLKIK